jgi:hypothetical protein
MALYREPRPWTAITQIADALQIGEQSGDETLAHSMPVLFHEYGWLDLGDLKGVRHRLSALATRMAQNQHVPLVATWRYELARALCEFADEDAWKQAEGLLAPYLSEKGGHIAYGLWARSIMVRVAWLRGQLHDAETQAQTLMPFFPFSPFHLSLAVAVRIHVLIGLRFHAEAVAVAEQLLAAIRNLGGLGCIEVELRLAASLAFHANGDARRAHTEMAETLRQIQLRADDITDPFWRNSYLTRNHYCARAQQLAREWGMDVVIR